MKPLTCLCLTAVLLSSGAHAGEQKSGKVACAQAATTMIHSSAEDQYITVTYANACPGGTVVPVKKAADGSQSFIDECGINGGEGSTQSCGFTLEAGQSVWLLVGTLAGTPTGSGHTWTLTAE